MSDNLASHRQTLIDAGSERREDVTWMVETGECLAGAAHRLGIKRDSLAEWCKDNGMRAELEILRRRDPVDDMDRSEHARAGAAARWAS